MRTRYLTRYMLAFLMAFGLLLSACKADETPAPPEEAAPAEVAEEPTAVPEEEEKEEEPELVKLKVSGTPFFDYQFWSVAKEFGWDPACSMQYGRRLSNMRVCCITMSHSVLPDSTLDYRATADTVTSCVAQCVAWQMPLSKHIFFRRALNKNGDYTDVLYRSNESCSS